MHKAVGLLSGGLDSALAAKLILDQGIEVHIVHLTMPWGCGKPLRVKKLAQALNVPLKVIALEDDYLQVLNKPKYGYGSAFNPCVDCHIYMVKKAAAYMREIGGQFVFTGEVLGQRPMSQRRECLDWVAKDGGVEGRLLRPLSARHLEETIVEKEGIVDRSKLMGIDGRSRKPQFALASQFGLKDFGQPGGGCLLTEKHFGERLKDVLKHGCQSIAETAILGLGRYLRLNDEVFAIIGRDNAENEKLLEYAVPSDLIARPTLFPGPVTVLRGASPSDDNWRKAAGLSQFFSKSRFENPKTVTCWVRGQEQDVLTVTAETWDEACVKDCQR